MGGLHRLVNEARISRFAEDLKAWTFDETRALGVEANVAKFRNEFRDLYDSAFPWVKNKRKKKDIEKPWLDDMAFKALVGEKSSLYSKKIKIGLQPEEEARLDGVNREVNRTRRQLKRKYFKDKLEETKGDLKAIWEVLGEALKGRRSTKGSGSCKYFVSNGSGIANGQEIAEGFCKFYCNVGPELASKIRLDKDCTFLDYMGDRVSQELHWNPTTPREVEDICRGLDPGKGMGWDGVSPRVIKDGWTSLSSLQLLYAGRVFSILSKSS